MLEPSFGVGCIKERMVRMRVGAVKSSRLTSAILLVNLPVVIHSIPVLHLCYIDGMGLG